MNRAEQLSFYLPDEETYHEIVWVILDDSRCNSLRDIYQGNVRIIAAKRRHVKGRMEWTFPGGKIEEGETPKEAAIRELLEETGLEIGPNHLHPASEHPIVFSKDGVMYKAYPFFVYRDEWRRKPKNIETAKLGRWRSVHLEVLYKLVVEGKLPFVVLKGFWQDAIEEHFWKESHRRDRARHEGLCGIWVGL